MRLAASSHKCFAGVKTQQYNAELKELPFGWRANFRPTGIAHSVVAGSAWAPTPWAVVQQAAWEALKKLTFTVNRQSDDGTRILPSPRGEG